MVPGPARITERRLAPAPFVRLVDVCRQECLIDRLVCGGVQCGS